MGSSEEGSTSKAKKKFAPILGIDPVEVDSPVLYQPAPTPTIVPDDIFKTSVQMPDILAKPPAPVIPAPSPSATPTTFTGPTLPAAASQNAAGALLGAPGLNKPVDMLLPRRRRAVPIVQGVG